MIFIQESSRVIYMMGNMELVDLGQISQTIQCHAFLKHVPEGLKFSGCGVSEPYCLARVNLLRGKKHGDQQLQEDHWKAVDAMKGARKHNQPSILSRAE